MANRGRRRPGGARRGRAERLFTRDGGGVQDNAARNDKRGNGGERTRCRTLRSNNSPRYLGMPVDKLLGQLGEAGMKFSDPEQVISSTEKVKLLGFLRRTHGKSEAAAEVEDSVAAPDHPQAPHRQRTEGGHAGWPRCRPPAKTVNVEVRAKRTYVKRSVIAEEASAEPSARTPCASCRNRSNSASRKSAERAEADRLRQRRGASCAPRSPAPAGSRGRAAPPAGGGRSGCAAKAQQAARPVRSRSPPLSLWPARWWPSRPRRPPRRRRWSRPPSRRSASITACWA